jgi:hypothetical protein
MVETHSNAIVGRAGASNPLAPAFMADMLTPYATMAEIPGVLSFPDEMDTLARTTRELLHSVHAQTLFDLYLFGDAWHRHKLMRFKPQIFVELSHII